VALSLGGAIGVDLEEYRALSDVEELMRICLTAEERELVAGVNGAESRAEHFYRVWTLKEAALKAVGTGLTIPISSFSVLRDLSAVAGVEVRLGNAEHAPAASAVYLTEVPLLAGHALAVASLTPIGRVVVMETGNPTIPQGA
jgi:4'-phosphopantetheinyl transferase